MPNVKQSLIDALTYLLLPLTLLSSLASAAENVTVNYPNNIEMIAVNGKLTDEPQSVSVRFSANTLKPIQLAFRLNTSYNERGNRSQFTSNLLIATFTPAHAGQYQLSVAHVRSSKTQKQFNQAPQITLKDDQGNNLALKSHQLSKNGFQIGRDFDAEIATFNRSNHAAAVLDFASMAMNNMPTNQAMPQTHTGTTNANVAGAATSSRLISPVVGMSVITPPGKQPTPTPNIKTTAQDQAEILHMLNYWYNQANRETKATFKQQIN
ncbi:DUF2057 family protein [Shewanella intestini]|uniref:DUF2057 domain-containing protein n=1 Tax=Shewanella intestini TaxID=2017544 RepID=A0ABS5I3C6_9GAMM|nr:MULTISPECIES: DUF2057 family protein [Shewanella]MBR9728533.1 DUF2057 domain-containing protein [Shewanella intestini]MRG36352.1 DUF2057 domain-containing protein [Shewanella sp. XMDDZSB0408]